jgi:hypothetical protein
LPARVDLGGKILEIPNDAAPVADANGEIAIDTTVADFDAGVIKYFAGEEMGVVAMPVTQFTSPNNGDVPTYNATNNEFEMIPSGGGVVTAVTEGAIAAATLDFVLGPADMYEIDLINVLPATDNVSLLARFGQSGSYVTSANYAYDSFQGNAENVNTGQTSMQVNVSGGTRRGRGRHLLSGSSDHRKRGENC